MATPPPDGLEDEAWLFGAAADNPSDGGSEFANVQRARDFEAAPRRAGKPVKSMYYGGGRHNGIFTDSVQHDEVPRAAAFLRRHLRD